ncbi:eukaryotic translation initiation factor 3 subunit I-like [Panicum miliaceum]|uniref:Eukaryotic translation initiation factor 3 subunit I-like n=1 Tax=Panicum miliaceum TaxID=4540 RepID=A0A3L6Q1R7_PANMI|nr:eukaryotic translation initiation factor 3 subunit I-like [Panicum miliaceum]
MRRVLMKGQEPPLAFLCNNLRRRRQGPRPSRLVTTPTRAIASGRTADTTASAGSAAGRASSREARSGGELLRFDALARSLESATGDALKVVTTDKFMDLAPTTQVRRDADDRDEATTVSHAFPISIAYAIFPRCVMDFVACDLLVSAETGEFALVVLGGGQDEMNLTMKTTVLANLRLNSTTSVLVSKGILDQLLRWHLILTDGGCV